jgi:CheY-like chemotaxis protein
VGPTLLIVDDREEFCSVAGQMLASDGFDVTGMVFDGDQALAFVASHHPDVVLLDVQLPGMDGFEVARRLALLPDAPDVVLTSSRSRGSYGHRLAESPVRGFIPKQDLTGSALNALIERPA